MEGFCSLCARQCAQINLKCNHYRRPTLCALKQHEKKAIKSTRLWYLLSPHCVFKFGFTAVNSEFIAVTWLPAQLGWVLVAVLSMRAVWMSPYSQLSPLWSGQQLNATDIHREGPIGYNGVRSLKHPGFKYYSICIAQIYTEARIDGRAMWRHGCNFKSVGSRGNKRQF